MESAQGQREKFWGRKGDQFSEALRSHGEGEDSSTQEPDYIMVLSLITVNQDIF
jgi:hypothetical protein